MADHHMQAVFSDNPIQEITFWFIEDHFGYLLSSGLSSTMVQHLIAEVKGPKLELPVTLSLAYGFRRSEAQGLHWDDMDFADNRISACHAAVKGIDEGTRSLYPQFPIFPIPSNFLQRQSLAPLGLLKHVEFSGRIS